MPDCIPVCHSMSRCRFHASAAPCCVPQEAPPPWITTEDVAVISGSFPALQSLALSGLDEAAPGSPEIQLQPLSQLTGLLDLSLASRQVFGGSTLASLSALKNLASLELQLVVVDDDLDRFRRVFPHFSSLWGLSRLTHLSCIHIDTDPPYTGKVDFSQVIDLTIHEEAYDRIFATLAGCQQLTSLHLPWAELSGGAVERLAAGLPRLTRLSVRGLWPRTQMPPCSWRELTLCGGCQMLTCAMFRLPLEGLDRLSMAHLELAPMINTCYFDDYIGMVQQHGPLLAAKLQPVGNHPGVRLSFHSSMGSAQLVRLIASLAAFNGVVNALNLSFSTQLNGSHVRALTTALPKIAHLSVCEPIMLISNDAWASFGTLPSLTTFSVIIDDGASIQQQQQQPKAPFKPQHMALLASSITRPLRVTVAQTDIEVAAAALRALQAEGHVGAGLITLLQRVA